MTDIIEDVSHAAHAVKQLQSRRMIIWPGLGLNTPSALFSGNCEPGDVLVQVMEYRLFTGIFPVPPSDWQIVAPNTVQSAVHDWTAQWGIAIVMTGEERVRLQA